VPSKGSQRGKGERRTFLGAGSRKEYKTNFGLRTKKEQLNKTIYIM